MYVSWKRFVLQAESLLFVLERAISKLAERCPSPWQRPPAFPDGIASHIVIPPMWSGSAPGVPPNWICKEFISWWPGEILIRSLTGFCQCKGKVFLLWAPSRCLSSIRLRSKVHSYISEVYYLHIRVYRIIINTFTYWMRMNESQEVLLLWSCFRMENS